VKTPYQLKTSKQIKRFAKSLGIDLIGIAPAASSKKAENFFKTFIAENRHGNMSYLADYKKRLQPSNLLSGAKSIIVIGINYFRSQENIPADHGIIARYAHGRDYHKVLRAVLKKLASALDGQSRVCVDSAPLLEKFYAQQAGLGFIGKNTTLITKEYGSFVLLGEIISDLALDYDRPAEGTCGTCTRCLDSCPTKALIGPGQMDARRCISYLTIEHKGAIPQEFHAPMGRRIFGCDICQEVCPYNLAFAKNVTFPGLKASKIAGSSVPLSEIENLSTDEQFLTRFAGSPLMRAKLAGLKRNAKIARSNVS
jgi:epoxyqueuosine reductase